MKLKKIIAAALSLAIFCGATAAPTFNNNQPNSNFTANAQEYANINDFTFKSLGEAPVSSETSTVKTMPVTETTTTTTNALSSSTTTTATTNTSTEKAATTTTAYITETSDPVVTTTAASVRIYPVTATNIRVEAGRTSTYTVESAMGYSLESEGEYIKDIDFDITFAGDIKVLKKGIRITGSQYCSIFFDVELEIPEGTEGKYEYALTINKATDIYGNDITASLPWTELKNKTLYVVQKGSLETKHTLPKTTTAPVAAGTTTVSSGATDTGTQTTTTSPVTFRACTGSSAGSIFPNTQTTYACVWGLEYNLIDGQDIVSNVDFDITFAEGITVLKKDIEIKSHNSYNELFFTADIDVPEDANGSYEYRVNINKMTDKNGNDISFLLPFKSTGGTLYISTKKETTTTTTIAVHTLPSSTTTTVASTAGTLPITTSATTSTATTASTMDITGTTATIATTTSTSSGASTSSATSTTTTSVPSNTTTSYVSTATESAPETSQASTTAYVTETTAPVVSTTAVSVLIYNVTAVNKKVEGGGITTYTCAFALGYNSDQDYIKDIDYDATFAGDIKVLKKEIRITGNRSHSIYFDLELDIPDVEEGYYEYSFTINKVTDIYGNDITSSLPWTELNNRRMYVAKKGSLETYHTLPRTTTTSGAETTSTVTTAVTGTQTTATSPVTFYACTGMSKYHTIYPGTQTTYTGEYGLEYNLVDGQDIIENIEFDVDVAEGITVLDKRVNVKSYNTYTLNTFEFDLDIPETANGRYEYRVTITKVTDKNGNDITALLPLKKFTGSVSISNKSNVTTTTTTTIALYTLPSSTTTTVASTTEESTTTNSTSTPLTVVGKWKHDKTYDGAGNLVQIPDDICMNIELREDYTALISAFSSSAWEKHAAVWRTEGDIIIISLTEPNEDIMKLTFDSENQILSTCEFDDGSGRKAYFVRSDTSTLGDVNSDGKVDAKDASLILLEYAQASTGAEDVIAEEQKKDADVNRDGKVDAKDASAVLQYYAYTSTGGKDPIDQYLG